MAYRDLFDVFSIFVKYYFRDCAPNERGFPGGGLTVTPGPLPPWLRDYVPAGHCYFSWPVNPQTTIL